MTGRVIRVKEVLVVVTTMMVAIRWDALAAKEKDVPFINGDGETTPTITAPAPPPGWLERDKLTGEWGGGRTWLKERGITLKPRLT